MAENEGRYEINHKGEIVLGKGALCKNQVQMLLDLFSQFGWECNEESSKGSLHVLSLKHEGMPTKIINVYSGSIRNESRNAYEKKIQLGQDVDPRKKNKKDTIILGIYIFEEGDSYKDAIFVAYPIDEKINYPTNPSIRHTFVNKILIQAKTKGFVYDEEYNSVGFRAEFIQFYLDNFYKIHYENKIINKMSYDSSGEYNILLYGVPGCGKSHEIKTKYCNDTNLMERVVFHPDYTYSDFVGQILPKVLNEDGKKSISYDFEPGPFTRILRKAVKAKEEGSDKTYYLIIEEINRGNAPAIFGDVFQLLDRDENGDSDYEISNESIADYVYKDKEKKVKIPSNLKILATMNSSDQNVFTLDTAFKRRWTMKHIKNDIDECEFGEAKICGSNISWKVFATKINDMIIDFSSENLSNEDNRLGAYFVKLAELKDPSSFGEKVLMYLWNDALKYNHDKVFKPSYRTLDELISGFKEEGFDVFLDKKVFDPEPDNQIEKGDADEET